MLIFAAQGTSAAAALALPFLASPERQYVTSDYVRIEVIPQAAFHKRTAELAFYELYFSTASRSVPTSEALLKYAFEEACNAGIDGMDAIHVACAVFGGAEELVTAEKSTKPIHRTTLVRTVSIFPEPRTG